MRLKRNLTTWSLAIIMLAASTTSMAADKPNIRVLWGDDIGVWNTSA